MVKGAGVAYRRWILTSYEVAGGAPDEFSRPGGTPEVPLCRHVSGVSFLLVAKVQ